MIYFRLFYEFLKIGLFSVGGGMATLPFLYDLSEKTAWFSTADIANMLAVSESTPGPIGINMATYVGYDVAGGLGACCATLGVIMPGVALVLLVSAILAKFRENRYIQGAFGGLRPASIGLIVAAGVLVCKITFLHHVSFQYGESILHIFDWKAVALGFLLLIARRWMRPAKKCILLFSSFFCCRRSSFPLWSLMAGAIYAFCQRILALFCVGQCVFD